MGPEGYSDLLQKVMTGTHSYCYSSFGKVRRITDAHSWAMAPFLHGDSDPMQWEPIMYSAG